MGRETTAPVTITDAAGRTLESADDVHVLLESTELILRGPLRRRYALGELQEVSATADLLRVRAADEWIEIELPPAVARRWAEKILTPPPTLAEKLGLSAHNPPHLIGHVTDPELHLAITDVAATPTRPTSASPHSDPGTRGGDAVGRGPDVSSLIAIAEVDDERDLDSALEELPPGASLWLVHRKGRGAWIGDGAIRQIMRSRGFVDTKVAAVSSARTATRYVERRAQPPPTPPAERGGAI